MAAFELKGRVALVTGAASGIGAATVRVLLEEGVKHVAILDVNEDMGIALQDELNDKYGAKKAKFFKCDVTIDAELFGAFKSVTNDHGYIDIVINNAGLGNESLSTYKKEIEVNVTAVVTGTLKALELMRKDHGGRGGVVVNISSAAALMFSHRIPIYSGTKAAVFQFSGCLGKEENFSRTGVRVMAMCFGYTDTPMVNKSRTFDKYLDDELTLADFVKTITLQSAESAGRALAEVCKRGASGSIWLSRCNEPAMDITATISQAHGLYAELMQKL